MHSKHWLLQSTYGIPLQLTHTNFPVTTKESFQGTIDPKRLSNQYLFSIIAFSIMPPYSQHNGTYFSPRYLNLTKLSQKKALLDGLHICCLQQPSEKALIESLGWLHLDYELGHVVFYTLMGVARISALNNLSKRTLLILLTPDFLSMNISLLGSPFFLWNLLPTILRFICLQLRGSYPNGIQLSFQGECILHPMESKKSKMFFILHLTF